jgi:5-methylcytosine-specific restriction endonuclease McrA
MGKWKVRGARKGARRWRVKTLIKKHRGKCVFCEVSVTWDHLADNQATVDHILPRSKGGTECLANLQLLCRKCNQEKGDTIIMDDGEVPDEHLAEHDDGV